MGKSARRKEGGFVLVWALLLMVVLLILGISGIGTSIFESLMSANDALHKQSFYQADGGTNTAAMLIEENVSCPGGFSATMSGGRALIEGTVLVQNLTLWRNVQPAVLAVPVSDALRDAYYFYNGADPGGNTLVRTNIKAGGNASGSPGSSYIMGSGYEGGAGHNQAKAGAKIDYDTFAQYENVRQSQSVVEIVWQHVIGFQGTCNY